ncbi:hypothetical protein PPERSA_02521 [Pseudocohnilembus persalinus]|uniref:Uncharacterized protein n=1 Tax=Pseudocohnilembus persalinus TaxID=266149 RepID=A0A0V0QB63_PSEPJ|nr:hypothetical protein PPERSA_02521 [Pseudocohnilembus persalinus]|eukprot:KRW99409.1 hypothetical protein PPERSA_02521 [Pseudocohnilembus persalinus]
MFQDIINVVKPILNHRGVDVIYKNDLPPELSEICNDPSVIMNIIFFMLNNCVNQTLKGNIIVHVFNNNDEDVSGAIKVHIRDTSERKWPSQTYDISDSQLQEKDPVDIHIAITQKLLGMIGPFSKIFFHNERSKQLNKASFYIYSDIKYKENILGDLTTDFRNLNNTKGTEFYNGLNVQQTIRSLVSHKTFKSNKTHTQQIRQNSHKKSWVSIKNFYKTQSIVTKIQIKIIK